MDIGKILYYIKTRGLKNTYIIYKNRKKGIICNETDVIKRPTDIYNILLLTNRDSDNVGDQVIEACDISIITTIMKNLGIPKNKYIINSRAAAIITQKYIKTKNPDLLADADRTIREADIVFFGGAPLFNYAYQTFYERTAVTLEIAKKYNKPVIFSAIGVEGYDESNPKCQRLKETLNFDCVKQITTRDGYDLLKQYKVNDQLVIDKVSDPAVYTNSVFREYTAKKTNKIGIFVFRANGFIDNKVNFTRQQAADLWVSLIKKLEENGYDYELLTSGHFGDEAFLDYLIREKNVNPNKCFMNMFKPETLVKKISSYKATVTCRLHPSIISFSLGVPSVSLVWNSKVTGFYNSINYPQRALNTENITADKLFDSLKQAMAEGVVADEQYLYTVYKTAFSAIKNIIKPDKDIKAFTPYELSKELITFKGTSEIEYQRKIKRKLRRIYNTYNSKMKD